jgi:hypothetical protein
MKQDNRCRGPVRTFARDFSLFASSILLEPAANGISRVSESNTKDGQTHSHLRVRSLLASFRELASCTYRYRT